MQKPKILVTGATGKTGAATTLQLLEKGYAVRALVHTTDARSDQLRTRGAEIVVGSLEDIVDLRAAMTGVQRAYFCPPLAYGMLRRATLFACAAEDARLEVVAVLSQWLADPVHPALHSREKWLAGRVFERLQHTGVVTINPGFFADNYMVALEGVIHFGLLAMPLGEGLNAPPSNEDIARVIVGALTNPADHIGRTYRPTGPKLLSPLDMAAVMGKVINKKVKYQNAPIKLFLKVAKSLALPEYLIEELYWYLQDYQRNSFGVGAPTNAVLEVGGTPPEDFEKIVRRYVAACPFATPTMGSRLLAIRNLIKGLLTPAPDPAAIAERLEMPKIAHATLAADCAEWRDSHLPASQAPRPQPLTAGKALS